MTYCKLFDTVEKRWLRDINVLRCSVRGKNVPAPTKLSQALTSAYAFQSGNPEYKTMGEREKQGNSDISQRHLATVIFSTPLNQKCGSNYSA